MEMYGPKTWSKAIQFSEILPLGLRKALYSFSSPVMNLHTGLPSMFVDSWNVKWGGAGRSGWTPALLLPVPVLSSERLAVAQGLLTSSASQYLISLSSHRPATSCQLTGDAPLSEITPANSAPRARTQIENAVTANNFYKLQSWQICQKHFGSELSLEINDPSGTQLVPY